MRSAFVEGIRSQVRWEGDNRVPVAVKRIAVVAQFSTTRKMTRSFSRLVHELAGHDYFVLVSSACTDPGELEWPEPLPANVAVLRKPNIGYDFGSWATAFILCPQIFSAERVLQINDSLVGPFWSLDAVLGDFESSYGDWWGMVRSFQVEPHLQSFFLGFTPTVLTSTTFQDYWASVKVESTKQRVIDRYEFGLSTRLYNEGFVSTAFLEAPRVVHPGLNPMIDGWRETLLVGVPFIKRELLTRPEVVTLGDRVPQVLRDEFDIDIATWM